MDRVKRVILLAVLLISSTISLITLNKTMHKRKIDEIEKNKFGKVVRKDDKYFLEYYTDGITVSVKKFPESVKKTFTCKSENCGIVKSGGIYAVIYDTYNYHIYDTKKGKSLYKNSKMRDVEFSMFYKNNKIINDIFVVYKDINNRTCLYNLRKKKITINGDFKELYANYTVFYQPNIYYVVAKNKDETYSLINYNSGTVVLNYDRMYCANDNYCVIDNEYLYDFNNEKYVVKKGQYKHIYMGIRNAIAVSDGNKVFVVNDEFKVLSELFNLNDYKNYNIKPYFKYGKDDIVYMIFSSIKDGKEESQIKFNLKTLKIEE